MGFDKDKYGFSWDFMGLCNENCFSMWLYKEHAGCSCGICEEHDGFSCGFYKENDGFSRDSIRKTMFVFF